jgi:hypothetical protein
MEKDLKKKFAVLDFNYQPDVRHTPKSFSNDIIRYGVTNLQPEYYLDLYYKSPTHSGIINKKSQMCAGQSISFSNGSAEFFAKDINFDEIWRKCITDYFIYGSFSLEIVAKTFENKIATILYQDPSNVRLTEQPQELALSSSWSVWDNYTKSNTDPIIRVNRFEFSNSTIESGIMLNIFEGPGVSYYSFPEYFSAIDSIETEIMLIKQQANFIKNNFSLSSIIKLPGTYSPEEMDLLSSEIKKNFSGPENAGKMLCLAADGDKAIEVIPVSVPIDSAGIEGFLNIARQNIMLAHNIPSPSIVGLPNSTGFNASGEELAVAYTTWFNVNILPVQNKVKTIFEKLFALSGYETELIIENYKLFI